ncbi:hypothetical protein ES332_D07G116100v1 [Gossypium tomentosum]|uniref:DUF4283 domain-containing protein n=1 Tax=Gossypium tomentosum TaxID=34277 RepID=A0A5D2K711_GOSTO|nr:hypothetical protein ES332_D07G116100v1 [Gossypium tomentosum]
MKSTLANLWRPHGGNGHFLVEGSPWTFNGHLLVFHRLPKGEDSMEVLLVFTDFWV